MGLDIRLPIGAMFALLGIVLTAYGLGTDTAMYERSLGINVNLWWGLVMFVFGGVFLWLGRRGARTRHTAGMHPAETSVEGRATEAREHALGLEREEAVRSGRKTTT